MAGVHFAFEDFKALLSLNIGIADRLDENRAESFTLLYCDFSKISQEIIDACLENVFRNSDAIVNHEKDYFFVLPYTDKYGAIKVKEMFDEFFSTEIRSHCVSYPIDGERPEDIVSELQDQLSRNYEMDLRCLDSFNLY